MEERVEGRMPSGNVPAIKFVVGELFVDRGLEKGDIQGVFEFPTIFSDSIATRYFRLESSVLGTLG